MSELDDVRALVERFADVTLFFVGGQGKSGTTWMERSLHAHPEISCRGEGHLGEQLAGRLRAALRQYSGFIEYNNTMFPELPVYPPLDDAGRRTVLRTALLAQLAHASDGAARIVGDRTPANAGDLRLLRELFPDARFVHMLRDPRDVAVSLWFHGERLQPGQLAAQHGSLAGFAVSLAHQWSQGVAAVRRDAAALGDGYLEVRYEDLHADGAATLSRVLHHLGASTDGTTVTECLRGAGFEALSGGRAGGEEDRSSHFRKGVVGDWREHLSADDANSVISAGGAVAGSLGYAKA